MAFMRYEGQGHEIEVPLPVGSLPKNAKQWIRERFEEIYRNIFGRTVPNVDLEIMSWGVVVSTPVPDLKSIAGPRAARKAKKSGMRQMYWGQVRQILDVPFYERNTLVRGDRIDGPALIIEAQTTTLVGPEFDATIDAVGNIVMNRRRRSA